MNKLYFTHPQLLMLAETWPCLRKAGTVNLHDELQVLVGTADEDWGVVEVVTIRRMAFDKLPDSFALYYGSVHAANFFEPMQREAGLVSPADLVDVFVVRWIKRNITNQTAGMVMMLDKQLSYCGYYPETNGQYSDLRIAI